MHINSARMRQHQTVNQPSSSSREVSQRKGEKERKREGGRERGKEREEVIMTITDTKFYSYLHNIIIMCPNTISTSRTVENIYTVVYVYGSGGPYSAAI